MTRFKVYFRVNGSFFPTPGQRAQDVENTHKLITHITATSLQRVRPLMEPGRWAPIQEARGLLRSKDIHPRYLGLTPGDVVEDIEAGKFYLLGFQGYKELEP